MSAKAESTALPGERAITSTPNSACNNYYCYCSTSPEELTNVNGVVYFRGADQNAGWELWKTDGTATGTALVTDVWPGPNGSYPNSLTNVNGALFFSSYNSGDMHIRKLTLTDNRRGVASQDVVFTNSDGIFSMEAGPDGRLYFSDSGAIWRLARG